MTPEDEDDFNTDPDYLVSDHAVADDDRDKAADPDQPNKSILHKVSQELAKDIETHNSFDSLNLPANATAEQKIAAYDEIAIHKGLALHLQKYKYMIDDKIKEL